METVERSELQPAAGGGQGSSPAALNQLEMMVGTSSSSLVIRNHTDVHKLSFSGEAAGVWVSGSTQEDLCQSPSLCCVV